MEKDEEAEGGGDKDGKGWTGRDLESWEKTEKLRGGEDFDLLELRAFCFL